MRRSADTVKWGGGFTGELVVVVMVVSLPILPGTVSLYLENSTSKIVFCRYFLDDQGTFLLSSFFSRVPVSDTILIQ